MQQPDAYQSKTYTETIVISFYMCFFNSLFAQKIIHRPFLSLIELAHPPWLISI